ncbi:GNAT family N-acetyltransferase [Bacillus nakamurai]|nr:GNAT family protein [Bacillus nakamurai]MCC9020909.1 GNAT family N-acetyltransferase [Bacillus nakamurai]
MISRCSLGRRVLRPLLHQRSNPPTAVEIGSTWYASSVQRTGVHTECKLLVLTHAFEVWNAVRVTLKTDARNQRSRSAIQRIGAQFAGIRRALIPAVDGGLEIPLIIPFFLRNGLRSDSNFLAGEGMKRI